ncbi:MAG: lysozyme inhibitor LprI family protein [Novosphingobium sp.]|nr:lysozyme inhibitor LprI family protein [Novosphingobium sp.]
MTTLSRLLRAMLPGVLVLPFAVTAGAASVRPAPPPPTAADSRTIHSCLNRADGSDTTVTIGQACIGIVAGPCITAALHARDHAAGKQACTMRELAVWHAELVTALRQVQHSRLPDLTAAVGRSQEAWKASLDALCPMHGYLPAPAYCMMTETAHRALLLRRLGTTMKNP